MEKLQFESRNKQCEFELASNIIFGKNVVFGSNCKKIKIGFGCFIGNDIYIDVPNLEIGDYTTIHHGSIIHGVNTKIGHNCWIGQYTIIDSLGGNTQIGNNVGIGAHSQLWSHMKFGDVLAGCNWNSSGSLIIKDDVWLVGHTIVGPITANEKSMLLTGGVMMKDMESNKIYAGNPACLIEKLGHQFNTRSLIEKKEMLVNLFLEFSKQETDINIDKFIVVKEFDTVLFRKGYTQFKLENQTYMPQYSEAEFKLIKFMLYDKAKFLPVVD
ncbi:MAG TPA: hypothetical protein PK055_05160 [Gammaproteobacteria bacterium]|nr:hypothetical protein [Xanthomonadales bacterium]MCB1595058.1 hypothetical protein [Xanthomonadales bacterium]HPI95665.1 hypothetical protein [Gammaproteobacteria bacterium]HPQ87025.1 hypothetical protein [Gammaproteobacteria bacterium]